MSSTFDLPEFNISEIVESLTGIIFAPVILPVASAVKQPVVQTAIKGGIVMSERCKEAVAEAVEIWENVAAEVNYDLIQERREKSNSPYSNDGKSQVTKDLMNLMSDLNADVGRMTDGVADLRLLVPLALGVLAMRQLLEQGLDFEDIPWYTLAWYAFDAFIKFNNSRELQLPNLTID
jgi:Protein of unknown function (DUF5132)